MKLINRKIRDHVFDRHIGLINNQISNKVHWLVTKQISWKVDDRLDTNVLDKIAKEINDKTTY